MFVIVWRYVVRPEVADQFLAAYGHDGAWAQLFGRSPEFRGVELIAAAESDIYLTIDRWTTEVAFDAFMAEFGGEYAQLDGRLEALTLGEELVARGWSVGSGS